VVVRVHDPGMAGGVHGHADGRLEPGERAVWLAPLGAELVLGVGRFGRRRRWRWCWAGRRSRAGGWCAGRRGRGLAGLLAGPLAVAPLVVVLPDVAGLDEEAFRVAGGVGQTAALEALHQDIALGPGDLDCGPVGLGDRPP